MNWTAPDPLNINAVTRSIYITELQEAVNTRRAEIGKSSLNFIAQNKGIVFKLSAIEELKYRVNEVAEDFGYIGGVANSELLGRAYVEITVAFGNKVTHYPIINDLRLVLETIEVKVDNPLGTLIFNWFDNQATGTPIAGYSDSLNNSWASIPDYIQTGAGITCPEGYPTCDNTVGGAHTNNVLDVTDISLIEFNYTDDVIVEGPLGGPYFEVGTSINQLIYPNSRYTIDDLNYYSHGGSSGSGGQIYTCPRDGSDSYSLLGDFATSFNSSMHGIFPFTNDIVVLAEYNSGYSNACDQLRYGRMDKSGVVQQIVDLPAPFDLLGTGGPYNNPATNYSDGFQRGTDVFFIYTEYFNDGGLLSRLHTSASAIMKVDLNGVMSLHSDLQSCQVLQNPRTPSHTINYSFYHATTSIRGNNSGFYYRVNASGCGIYINTPAPLPNPYQTFNGVPSALLDYKGDTIWNYNGIYHSENYLSRNGATPTIDVPDFDTINRVGAYLGVTWTPVFGAFRYRLQRRVSTGTSWITSKNVEASDPAVGTDTIGGVFSGISYYIRIQIETGQGLLTGTEEFVPA